RGADALHAELAGRDPVAAARLDARNERRVVRALEVIELTGRPFSASMPRREYVEPTVMIGLTADREVLSARIAERVESMWEAGLLDEVRGLAAMGLRESPTARRALGYSQALAHLDGRLRAEQARADTAIATRQYARRQMAWFRADPRITWLAHDAPDLLPQALAAITERHQES
ncbi:MAG: tRNA dimethylallyltransferase, partial [Ornithinimicrobium sp.]